MGLTNKQYFVKFLFKMQNIRLISLDTKQLNNKFVFKSTPSWKTNEKNHLVKEVEIQKVDEATFLLSFCVRCSLQETFCKR